MLINLWDIDGNVIDLKKYKLKGLSLVPESPTYESDIERLDSGTSVLLDKRLNPRILEARFFVRAKDYEESILIRDELYALLHGYEQFYIGENKQSGKRWLVSETSAWSPERHNAQYFSITMSLLVASGLAESVGTTLDPRTFNAEKWQVGQGLTVEDFKYAHDTTSFQIYNAGNVTIDPRQMDIKIKYQGASNNLRIKNVTTGDEWSYNGSSGSSDTILLDGIRSLKNGSSIFGNTNKKLISVNPGWNSFVLQGASGSFLVSFDFRFCYL